MRLRTLKAIAGFCLTVLCHAPGLLFPPIPSVPAPSCQPLAWAILFLQCRNFRKTVRVAL